LSRSLPRLGAISAIVTLCLSSSLRASDGFEPIGVSLQANSRGGADTAVGDTALSQVDNPATLALQPRDHVRLDSGNEVAFVRNVWRGPLETSSSQAKVFPLINTGISVPINDRLTLGAAFNSRGGFGSRFEMRHLMIPFMERRVHSDLKVVSMPVNMAYKITDKLSLGAGFRTELATARFGTVIGPIDMDISRGYAVGGGFQLGLHYQARKNLAFGVGYRSPTWFNDLEGGRAKASLLGLLPLELGDSNIDSLRLPQRVSLGSAWDITERIKLIGETRWINYRNSTLNKTTLAVDGPIDIRYPLPMGYRNQGVFIIGTEIKLSEHWKFGTGYHYAMPNISRRNVFPEGTIIAEHHLTFGLRYETKKWWVGAGYLCGFPTSLRGNGRSRIPFGIDYGFSSVHQTQQGVLFGFGVSL
jgi:long-subunit fatty acid transport protein